VILDRNPRVFVGHGFRHDITSAKLDGFKPLKVPAALKDTGASLAGLFSSINYPGPTAA
jgi:hypothetical protein